MIKFDSSNEVLKRGFEWARKTALSYVFENAPGGPCYEAALPGRGAFCMRDVSHQALGAHFLGLQPHNRNMMRLFARNIAESRDWCSFWETNTRGEACEVDYTSDAKFWYNLPANFDVSVTCERLMEWTGDAGYLTDSEMARFHGITVGEYVKRWDRDGDGIVDRDDADRARGVGSYDEDEFNGYTAAADTLALEAAAYFTAARMYRLTGDEKNAALSRENGEALAEKYRREWWNAAAGHYENNLYPDGTMGGLFTCAKAIAGEYTTDGEVIAAARVALAEMIMAAKAN